MIESNYKKHSDLKKGDIVTIVNFNTNYLRWKNTFIGRTGVVSHIYRDPNQVSVKINGLHDMLFYLKDLYKIEL